MTERRPQLAIGVAVAVIVIATVGVGIATPGYRPTTDAVSRLGSRDEPWRLAWRCGLVAFGVLVAVGASAIARRHPTRRHTVQAVVVAYGVCTAAVGLLPKDPPGAPHTLASRLHVDAAVVAGALLLGAIALVALDAPSPHDRSTSLHIGATAVAAVAVFPFLWGTPVYGLIELLLLGSAITWLLALAFAQSTTVSACAGKDTLEPRGGR